MPEYHCSQTKLHDIQCNRGKELRSAIAFRGIILIRTCSCAGNVLSSLEDVESDLVRRPPLTVVIFGLPGIA